MDVGCLPPVIVLLRDYIRMKQQSLRSLNWRQRREEYLRAAGRLDDLIREGYEPAIQLGKWSAIPGGRAPRTFNAIRGVRLLVVKGPES